MYNIKNKNVDIKISAHDAFMLCHVYIQYTYIVGKYKIYLYEL